MIDTNLGGVFHTCRAAARGMMRRRPARSSTCSSVVGVHGNPGQTNYAASKAGIIGFTKALARELGDARACARMRSRRATSRPRSPTCCPRRCARRCSATRRSAGSGAGGRGRGGTLPLLRRGLVHHGRGAARRRRPGDVSERHERQRTAQSRDHRHRRGDAARQRHRDDLDEPARGRSGAGPITQFDSTGYRSLRLRGEGLRPDGLHRPQDGAAHGPLRAPDRRRRAAGRGGLRARHRGRAPSGSARRSPPASAGCRRSRTATTQLRDRGPDRVEPVLDPRDHPQHGRRLGLDGARHAGAAVVAVHRLRRLEHGDRRRAWTRSGSAAPTSMFCGGTEAPVTEVGIAGFARHARALAAQRRPGASEPARSTPGATGSSWARAARCSCSRSSSTRRRAARRSTRELVGYGVSSDANHITEPDPTGANPARAMKMALRRRGHRRRPRSTTSTPTATSTPIGDATETRDDQDRARRGERAQDADLLDEGRDRPLPRRRRRGRGDLLAARDPRRRAPADDQPTSTPTRVRPRLHPERGAPRPTSQVAMSNSFGFGGHNASIVLRRYED